MRGRKRGRDESAALHSLHQARQLTAPGIQATVAGELEGAAFWEQHAELLRLAWLELQPRHAAIYGFDAAFEDRYLTKEVRNAVAELRDKAAADATPTRGNDLGAGYSIHNDVTHAAQTDASLAAEKTAEEAPLWDLFEEVGVKRIIMSQIAFTSYRLEG